MEAASLYVAARTALLDALESLGAHREALILVGAQAVYLRVGGIDLGTAPFTTDADLALDVERLADEPGLGVLLEASGFVAFETHDVAAPGRWTRETLGFPAGSVVIDLLVPQAFASPVGRRGARLGGAHGASSAMKVRGIEGAIVDNETLSISSLDPGDERTVRCRVAGPAALVVAKCHKLGDRRSDVDRLLDKDAADVYRLLRGVSGADLRGRMGTLLTDMRTQEVTREAIELLRQMFGGPLSPGQQMTIRHFGGLLGVRDVRAPFEAVLPELTSLLD